MDRPTGWAIRRRGSLGRLTLNPLAHIDWIGTVLFPLIAMITGCRCIGWAKPVPVNMPEPPRAAPRLRHRRGRPGR